MKQPQEVSSPDQAAQGCIQIWKAPEGEDCIKSPAGSSSQSFRRILVKSCAGSICLKV